MNKSIKTVTIKVMIAAGIALSPIASHASWFGNPSVKLGKCFIDASSAKTDRGVLILENQCLEQHPKGNMFARSVITKSLDKYRSCTADVAKNAATERGNFTGLLGCAMLYGDPF